MPQALAWDDIRFYLAVAREGSLSGAARLLDVEHSTVARRVAALEGRIGVRLFDRLPRSWALTAEGEALLIAAKRIENEALAFSRGAAATSTEHGTVRVSAPPAFASHFLMPHLAACSTRWPGITLDLVSEVRTANLHRREADLSLRFMRPTEPGLAARKLGELNFRLYAAPAWLDIPEADWRFLGYGEPLDQVPHQQWLSGFAGARPFVLRSNDLNALRQACGAGLGLAMLPAFLAHGDNTLVEIPATGLPLAREIWSVVHPDVRHSPRVRLIAGLVAELIHLHAAALT
ncbi:MAG: LysR family transcriptional regulator [Collimonas sp.]|uniref:LysR family transcriptional regulator n=1 Tax=Collimonas sp. TaxID=1963772 RepID=UPI003264DEFD